jgi:hypothetical protein
MYLNFTVQCYTIVYTNKYLAIQAAAEMTGADEDMRI